MRRGRIDYRMQRRAVLRDVDAGLTSPVDVCDAHPDLVRAGRNIGDETGDDCPICGAESLRHVTYLFTGKGGKNGEAGRAVTKESLARQVKRLGDVNVYTVEVCPDCHWHHLLESYWTSPAGSAVG